MGPMREETQQNWKHGFTLLEILIAIFLLALVVAMVLGPFTGIIAASREAERKVDLYQTARSLMDILAADIRGIFALPAEGGEVSFKASVVSVDLDTPTPRLDFVTTHSLVIGPQQKPFLTEVGYRLRKDPKSGIYTLWRRAESPPSLPLDEGGREVPLCRSLERFKLEFLYGDESTPELTDQIPRAIVIDFTLNMDGERESFITMARPMIALPGRGNEPPVSAPRAEERSVLEREAGQQKSAR